MLDKLYYLNVGPEGSFRPSGNPQYDSVPADVDRLFEYLREKKINKIVIYCHGGLVNENAGMEAATRLTRYITGQTSAHPICLVWETGFFETIKQRLDTIHSTRFFQKILVKIIKVAGKKLGIDVSIAGTSRGVENLPETTIETELKKESPFDDYHVNMQKRSVTAVKEENGFVLEREIAAEMEEEITTDSELELIVSTQPVTEISYLDVDKVDDTSQPGSRGLISFGKLIVAAVKITMAVIRRHIRKRDHGFYPTIIEEILRELYIADFGSWVWEAMKQKAGDMWLNGSGHEEGLQIKAGNYLLGKLRKYASENDQLSIDLVGHSAGSIIICNLIKQISERNISLPLHNIIFMAPACRSEMFAETIIKNKHLFKRFRMFTMRDQLEMKDRLVPVIYPRSLLYFISGVLEDKGEADDAFVLGLERLLHDVRPYDNFPELAAVRSYLAEVEDRLVLSQTEEGANEGFRSQSIRHGDFDNDGEATLDSIMHIIKS